MQQKKKILIVDDEPDVVIYLSALFQDHGYDVAAASDGKEALKQIESGKPDLITLDITMPHDTGIRFLESLQKDSINENIPVFVVTGTPGIYEQLFSGDSSVKSPAAFFEKPIDRTTLLQKVAKVLKT